MNEHSREALDAYYVEADSWGKDRQDALRASRRTAWITAWCAAAIAVLEAIALVVLMPLKTVEPYTIVNRLYERGEFMPVSLWSVMELAKQLRGLGEVRVGGLQFAPVPITSSRTSPIRALSRPTIGCRASATSGSANANASTAMISPVGREVGIASSSMIDETLAKVAASLANQPVVSELGACGITPDMSICPWVGRMP